MATLSSQVDFILDNYHNPLKENLPIILALSEKVARVHGDKHPEIIKIDTIIHNFVSEMTAHLRKEENVLFPLMRELDTLKESGGTPNFHCGSLTNPIRQMNSEHSDFDQMFAEVPTLSNNYTAPADACNSYRRLFEQLSWLDTETVAHALFESDTLFMRAIEIESHCQ